MQKKVILPLLLIIGSAIWLASTNMSKANYFFNVNEMPPLGDPVYESGLKVKGRIVPGTIVKDPLPVNFTIMEGASMLKVVYVGTEPLPDMFKDHAEAVVEGKMRADGVFEANHLQAKCASKYEALAPDAQAGQTDTKQPNSI